MPEAGRPKKAARPAAKKAATTARAPGGKPRKAAAPAKAKPSRAAASAKPVQAAPVARNPPAPRPAAGTPRPAAPAAVQWLPAAAPRPFDAATGAWIPVEAPVTGPPPEAYKKGAARTVVANVIFGIDLAVLGLFLLFGLYVGALLVFFPDSSQAQRFVDAAKDTTRADLVLNALLSVLIFGVIPLLWVLCTRVRPWIGARRFLQLRARVKDLLLGIALVPLMLIGVILLAVTYTCATNHCDLREVATEEEEDDGLPGMGTLTWPIAILIAVCAGIGEEIFFRGLLRRWIGVWGQAGLFGLAHAGNGVPLQVVFAFLLGIAFGYLHKRGWSLLTLIIAHAVYDITVLGIALAYG